MAATPTVIWFQNDLRLSDQPALTLAVAAGSPIVPVFILDRAGEGDWPPGGASRWWLHHSLEALERELASRGSQLILRTGPAEEVLSKLVQELGAQRVVWNHRYEPAARQREERVSLALARLGVSTSGLHGSLLFPPGSVQTRSGTPFQVFTPFWKTCLAAAAPVPPSSVPDEFPTLQSWPDTEPLDSLNLLPRIPWDRGFTSEWTPGEAGAKRALQEFVQRLDEYAQERDRPDHPGTSWLSPHLHFGEISPRQVWHAVQSRRTGAGASIFLSEIGWREFAHHVLFHFPHTATDPLRKEFRVFPWSRNRTLLRAWQQGMTGYPIVDAGMRQLWTTGWMHNRVRMIVGSFLTKDLLISWKEGAKWFWDTLVDADLANNTLGWQWVSGCGADAAPYFRVFNPVLQGKKFDPQGDYVRRWVPELQHVSTRWIHEPWKADPAVLKQAGIELGETYPQPVVDHADARRQALEAFKMLGGRNADE